MQVKKRALQAFISVRGKKIPLTEILNIDKQTFQIKSSYPTWNKGDFMADIDQLWFMDHEHGHVEYLGANVEKYAKNLSVALNCQVDIYKMDYSFTVKSPAESKESAGTSNNKRVTARKPRPKSAKKRTS